MMVVVVDIDLIAIPLPVAATVEVVRGNYPVGAVVEDDIAGAVIDGARDENFPNVLVVTTGIVAARNDAVVLIVPAAIIGAGFLFFPECQPARTEQSLKLACSRISLLMGFADLGLKPLVCSHYAIIAHFGHRRNEDEARR